MTISEYTRGKCARRLRAIASLPDLNWPSHLRCLGVSTRKDAVLLLAEMVEAGELTCRMRRDENGMWHCSNCDDLERCGDGIESWCDSWAPDFCPDCGARVIRDE